jgi:sigma-E factor negative regulatory protein RseA
MSEERPSSERPSFERNGERDSQLSAMFDGELAAAECELLARRLTRDEVLRAQWSRYSMIGAALRAERGVALHDRVAWRVQSALVQETTYGDDSATTSTKITAIVPGEVLRRAASRRWARFGRPMFGAGIAASVAAASILFLRGQGGMESPELLAAAESPASIVLVPEGAGAATPAAATSPAAARAPVSNGEPERYSTPVPSSSTGIVPPTRLANYVVAHSEYSGPLSRRLALLGLVANESAGEAPATADPADLADVNGAPDAQ